MNVVVSQKILTIGAAFRHEHGATRRGDIDDSSFRRVEQRHKGIANSHNEISVSGQGRFFGEPYQFRIVWL
jgi:hypothetical protein